MHIYSDIDTSYFVLTVDLWSADATKEVNLVRHSATSPSISAGTHSSYPPPPEDLRAPSLYVPSAAVQALMFQNDRENAQQQQLNNYQQMPNAYHQHQYPQSSTSAPSFVSAPLPPPPVPSQAQQQGYYNTPAATPITPTTYQQAMMQGQGPLLSPSGSCDPRSHPSGMFTRNLIGSLCVSAFKLTDPDNQMGVWFILQDLSVRTEGSFRYVNLK